MEETTELLRCAECDRPLAEDQIVCPHCSETSDVSFREATDIDRLLRRARGQLIFGSMMLPWVFAPLALQNTILARQALCRSGKPDAAISSAITRLQIVAGVASVLAFGLVIAWLAYSL